MTLVRSLQLLVALSGVLCASCSDAPSVEETVADVRSAVTVGDRGAALAAIERLERSSVPSPQSTAELAWLWIQVGDAARAVWHLEKALELFPDEQPLRLALGRAAMMISNPALTIRVANQVPVSSESYLAAQILLGEAQIEIGDLDAGLETLRKLDQTHPDRVETALARAAALLAERQAEPARAALERARALATEPSQFQTADGLELLLYRVELTGDATKRDEVIDALTTLVARRPDFWPAWELLTTQFAAAGRLEDAEALIAASLAADAEGQLVPLYALHSSVLKGLGETERSLAAAVHFAEESQVPMAWAVLADHHQSAGDYEAMLGVFERGLEAFPDDPALTLARVESLVSLERLDEARLAIDASPKAVQESPRTEIARARIELQTGDAEAARSRLERVVPILDDGPSQFWLGASLEKLGMLEEAGRRYAIAQRRAPRDPVPPLASQHLAFLRRDHRAALGHSAALVRIAPALDQGWIGLVSSHLQLDQPELALKVISPLLTNHPERAIGPQLEGRALRALERFEEARAAFDRAEGLGAEVAVDRATTLALAGNTAEAIEMLKVVALERSDDAAVQLALAKAAFLAGDEATGLAASERALEIEPNNLAPLRERCFFLAATARQSGLAECERYLAALPIDAEAHYYHGSLLASQGRKAEAIAAYRRAGELDKKDFRPRNNLANLLGEQGKLDQALVAAQEAFALSDEHPVVADTLGALYVRRGLANRAVPILEKAHSTLPSAEIGIHLAEAYQGVGRDEDARRVLAEVKAHPETSTEERAAAEALSGAL